MLAKTKTDEIYVQTATGEEFGLSKMNHTVKTTAIALAMIYGDRQFLVGDFFDVLGIRKPTEDRNAQAVVRARLAVMCTLGLVVMGRNAREAGVIKSLITAKLQPSVAARMIELFHLENNALNKTQEEKVWEMLQQYTKSTVHAKIRNGIELETSSEDFIAAERKFATALDRMAEKEYHRPYVVIKPFEEIPQTPFDCMVSYLGGSIGSRVHFVRPTHLENEPKLLILDTINHKAVQLIAEQFKDNLFSSGEASVLVLKTKPGSSKSGALGRFATIVRNGYVQRDELASSPAVNGRKYYRLTPEALRIFGIRGERSEA